MQHVGSGEARYVCDWPALEAFVEAVLQGGGAQDETSEVLKTSEV